jgi:hypothetical protein
MFFQQLLDFILEQEPTYVNGDLSITFYKDDIPLIKAKHYGWKCPSIYGVSIPEDGYGEIDDCYKNRQKLLIKFESFSWPRQVYLTIEVLSKDSIVVRYDKCFHYNGVTLTRLT